MSPLRYFALVCAALAQGSGGHRPAYPRRAQRFRGTIPQSASLTAPGWREGFSPTSGCRFRRTPARVPTAGTTLWGDNPSVSFADSSLYTREPWKTPWAKTHKGALGDRRGRKLKGEQSEPEGAAKFILRPRTPARRSLGWGVNAQGCLGKNRRERERTKKPKEISVQVTEISLPKASLV